MIRFACPSCNRTLQAQDDRAGKTAQCPGCQQHMQIPQPMPADTAPYVDYRELQPEPRVPPEQAAGHTPGQTAAPDSDAEIQVPLSRRRAERPPNNWGWRWCSPSMLVLSLLLLPLPFLSVQCVGPGITSNLMHQSGLQVMVGGYSKESSVELWENLMKRAMPIPMNAAGALGPFGQADMKVKPAWCVTIIPFLLLAAVALGLVLRPTVLRVPAVGGVVLCALVLLFIQMAVGFPLDREVRDSMDRSLRQQQQMFNQKGGGPPGMGGGLNPFGMGGMPKEMTEIIQTRYTGWFWIWFVLIIGALGPLAGELVWMLARRERRWQPARGAEY
jgi:hypothetical protein